jgi:hypothetical protein
MNYAGSYVGPSVPDFLLHLIDLVGGRNMFDQPNYRVIHAGYRFEPAGGTWLEWDHNIAPQDRTEKPRVMRVLDAGGRKQSYKETPWRRVVEVRMALKYPEVHHSADNEPCWWVLEKWHSPESYGGAERWYLPNSSGGTKILVDGFTYIASQGDYPYEGAYEHQQFEFPYAALTEACVVQAIQRLNRVIEDPRRPSTAYGRMLRRVYNQQEMEKKMAAQRRQQDLDLINECDTAFGNNPTSFGGGKKRRRSVNDFAERAGIRIHTGVS